MLNLEQKIEALLFYKAEPMTVLKISEIFGKKEDEVLEALESVERNLEGRGLVLVRESDNVAIGTHPGAASFIEMLQKEELSKDLGKAGLETLTIILYREPLTRVEIDYIRGVNSSFILRNLSARGLVRKTPNPKDQRSILYRPTLELLSYLGVKKASDLPEYDKIRAEVEQFERSSQLSEPRGEEEETKKEEDADRK